MKNIFLALTLVISTGIVTTVSASAPPTVCATPLTPQPVDNTGKKYSCCLSTSGVVYCPNYPVS